MYRFDLSGVEIAKRSGLTPAQVSNFRNGHNLRIDSVERILQAMPAEARQFMLSLVALEDATLELPSETPREE